MARHALICTCGDCAHWEVIAPEPSSTFRGFLGTAWAHPRGVLKCLTCGHEFAVTISVDPHDKLAEVEVA